MIKIRINKDINLSKQPASTTYNFNSRYGSHTAQLTLDLDGNYVLSVDSNSHSQYEQSAKRSPIYKESIARVSNEILNRLNNYDRCFREIYKRTIHLTVGNQEEKHLEELVANTQSQIEAKADVNVKAPDLSKIKTKRYERKKFKMAPPTKAIVEEMLKEEAEHKFFSLWGAHKKEKDKFVSANIESVYEDRCKKYDKLKKFFENVQDIFAAKANETYRIEYKKKRQAILNDYQTDRNNYIFKLLSEKKAAEEYLFGPSGYVENNIKGMPFNIHLPFDLIVSCDYNQTNSILEVEAYTQTPLPILDVKGNILSTGRISIKKKLQREVNHDAALCQLGLAFYICGYLFNVSANIHTIRFSLVQDQNKNGYYWVQFSRNQFFSLDFANIDPLLTLEHFPHVISYEKATIKLIDRTTFSAHIKDALLFAQQATDPNKTVIPISDALTILKALPNANDLRQAYEHAKDNEQTLIVVDKKYKNILREL